jgi:hypothetical protein
MTNNNLYLQRMHANNMDLVAKAIIDTLDDVTAYIMKYSDLYVQSDKHIHISDSIQFGLWINISKKRLKQIEFEGINITCELALKGMTQKEIAIRVMQIHLFDPLTATATHALRFMPLGGVIFIETLDIPPAPFIRGGFKMREIKDISHKVNRVPYQDVDWEGNIEEPPTKISFVVPKTVLIRSETPYVGWWDPKMNQWKLNGITGTIYDPETRRIEFSTTHLTTALAIVHQRTFDLPYQQWFLTPLQIAGKNYAIFSITPKAQYSQIESIDQIVFVIHNNKCKLIAPNRAELAPVFDKMMDPMDLLIYMAQNGINLLPEDRDAEFTDFQPKYFAMEMKAYESIATVCSICSFSSSKWNQENSIPKSMGILRISADLLDPSKLDNSITDDLVEPSQINMEYLKQHLFLDLTKEDAWELMFVEEGKCGFINCVEQSKDFSCTVPEGLQTHLNIALALQEKHQCEPGEIESMIFSSNQLLGDTVRKIFNVVRPLGW